MDPFTIGALVKGGSALAKYAFNRWGNKQPSFDDTDYGRFLKGRMKYGLYNPSAMSKILGRVGKETGNVAQTAKTELKGNLIGAGMEGSIAGQGKVASIDRQRVDKIGDVAADIETKNEIAKEQAKEDYAKAKGGYSDRLREMNQANTQNLVGGLLDAAGSYVGGEINQNLYKDLDINDPAKVTDFLRNSADPQAAIDQIYKLSMGEYYAGGGRSGQKSAVDISPMVSMGYDDALNWYKQNLSGMTELDMSKAQQILNSLFSKLQSEQAGN